MIEVSLHGLHQAAQKRADAVPELRRWVLTSGRSFFEGNGLHVEERLLASEARVRRLCEMQAELAILRGELRV